MRDQAVILVVEDNENDLALIHKAFQATIFPNPVQYVRDGEEAIAYLAGEGKFQNRGEYPLPDLILLDLKMPRVDGFEVLQWIRAQEGLRGIPVVVLTTSDNLRDVNRAYELGANSFFVKDIDLENFRSCIKLLRTYWLGRSELPTTYRQKKNPCSAEQISSEDQAGRE